MHFVQLPGDQLLIDHVSGLFLATRDQLLLDGNDKRNTQLPPGQRTAYQVSGFITESEYSDNSG